MATEIKQATNDPTAGDRLARRVTITGSVVNILLAIAKMTGGILFNSRALIADALDSLTDLITDVVTLIAYPMSRKPVDDSHPYGHGRIETLAAMIVAGILIIAALLIGYKAVSSMITGDILQPSWPALIFAAASLISKEWLYRWTNKVARKLKSRVLAANALNHRGDAFSSIAVLTGLLGALFIPGAYLLDSIASLVVVMFILRNAWDILSKSTHDLLDAAQDNELKEKIRVIALKVDDVKHAHRIRTRRYGYLVYADLDIEVDGEMSVTASHDLSHTVKHAVLMQCDEIADVQIHVEPEGDHEFGEGFVRVR